MDKQKTRLEPWKPDYYIQECQLVNAALPIEDSRVGFYESLTAIEVTERIWISTQS